MRTFLSKIFSVFLFSLLCTFTIAQEIPRWEDYGPALTANNVNDVVVSPTGDVFVLSNSKLFQLERPGRFTPIEGIQEFGPNFIEMDDMGIIWMVARNNFQYNGNHLAFTAYQNGTLVPYLRENISGFPNDNSSNDDDITDFYVDDSNVLWFGFNNGDVGKMEPLSSGYTHYPNDLVADEEVRDMTVDPTNGYLYAAIDTDVFLLTTGGWSNLTSSLWSNASFIEAVEVTPEGAVYFGGYNGIHVLDQGTITTYNIDNSDNPINIIDDIKYADELVVFSGNDINGIDYVLAFNETFDVAHKGVAESSRLFDFQSTLIFESLEPTVLWLGTDEDGLVEYTDFGSNFYNNQTISLPMMPNGTVNKTAFVGDLAFVATNDGVTILKDSIFLGLHPYYTPLPSLDLAGDGKTNDIVYDGQQLIYAATDSGISIMDINFNAISVDKSSNPTLPEERFYKVFRLGVDTVLAISQNYMVTFVSGNLQESSYVELAAANLPPGSQWNQVIPEKGGFSYPAFWVASSAGLQFFSGLSTTDYTSDLYHFNVTAMAEGPDGDLWLGFDLYGEAIQVFDRVDQWQTIDLPELFDGFLTEQDIVDLEFDFNGTLWVLAQFRTSGNSRVTKLLEYKNDAFTIIDKQSDIQSYSKDLAISPTGEKWISNNDRLHIYVDDSYDGVDPCATVDCPFGTQCVDGECIPVSEACLGITCPDGDVCYAGSCYFVCDGSENSPCIDIGPNQVAGPGASVLLDAGEGWDAYEWSTGEITQTILVNSSGQYWVNAYDLVDEFYSSDTIIVLVEADPLTGCPDGFTERDGFCFPGDDPCNGITCPDGQVCFGGSCYITCSGDPCDASSACYFGNCFEVPSCDNVVCPEGQTCYAGSCYNTCVDPETSPCVDLGPNQVAGSDASVELDAGEQWDIVEWSTGDTTQTILVNASGQYWVVVYDEDAAVYSTDTINILIQANEISGCPDGLVERDGFCFPPDDPCDTITCPEGQVCFGGSCYPACSGDPCDESNLCYFGNCFETASCDGVVCPEGTICKDGECYVGCAFNSDCPEGTVCATDVCMLPEEACSQIDCPEGSFCVYGECYPLNPIDDGLLNLSGSLFGASTASGSSSTIDDTSAAGGSSGNGGSLAIVGTSTSEVTSTSEATSTKGLTEGDSPIAGATIYLFNQDQTEINAFDVTDENGLFNFENLGPGFYKVFVDYPPYKVRGDALVELNADFTNTNMDIVLVDTVFELRVDYVSGVDVDFAMRNVFTVYPNPTEGIVMLSSSEEIGDVLIRISDASGRLIRETHLFLPETGQLKIADLSGEARGLKMIEIYRESTLIHRSSLVIVD